MMPRDLTYKTLEDITNSFSEDCKIGSGGYGQVYKVRRLILCFSVFLVILTLTGFIKNPGTIHINARHLNRENWIMGQRLLSRSYIKW